MGGPEYLPRPGINVKTQSSVGQFQNLGRIAFMAALIAAGAYLTVHVGQIPLSFQEVFICLGGLALGPRRGVLVVLLYLLAGALGLPVFVGGKGGPAAFIGPTGGYMAGFILLGCAPASAAAWRRKGSRTERIFPPCGLSRPCSVAAWACFRCTPSARRGSCRFCRPI